MTVAVSKTVGIKEVSDAIAAGITDFAENRSNLLKDKQQIFPDQNWHFIGRVQTNKVKDYVGKAKLIHSVLGERALLAINKRAVNHALIQDVLIEVNMSGEESKDGIYPDKLDSLLRAATECAAVRVRGLMTMAPLGDADLARKSFAGLRELRDSTAPKYQDFANIDLTELSMGMTDDFEIAIEEGATIVRIGRKFWR
ncbi:YggS family pyridoxal phosphate enzyme [Actinomycetota bacterium]|nr:YggS family pyridoxal phosphate enzyme [Actinomycetota bacterium]